MKKFIVFLFILLITFNNNVFASEEQENIINNYYNNISMWAFEKAYSIIYKPKISTDQLKKIYTSNWRILSIFVDYDSIKTLWNNKFNYKVIIWYKDKFLEEKYDVSAEIIDDKIRTYSVKQIKKEKVSEKISYWNIKAYIEEENLTKKLFLEKDWKKIFVDKLESLKDENWEFNEMSYMGSIWELELLWNWNILKFVTSWWEISWTSFYIIPKNKIIWWDSEISLYWFTTGKKYFYICWESWMWSSQELKIYNAKTWLIDNNLAQNNDDIVIWCEKYDEKSNNLIYTIYNYKNDKNTKYMYNFGTKQVKEIK